MQLKRDDASDADFVARFFHPLAVNADMAGLDHMLGEGPALDEPDEEQEAVDPHFFLSLASSANA